MKGAYIQAADKSNYLVFCSVFGLPCGLIQSIVLLFCRSWSPQMTFSPEGTLRRGPSNDTKVSAHMNVHIRPIARNLLRSAYR